MIYIANTIGVIAVVLYLFSYQLKNRVAIVCCNGISRIFYVLQYVLLGAFAGAVIDFLAMIITFIAMEKTKPFIKKYQIPIMALCYLSILIAGGFLYVNVFSLFSIVGVIFEITSLWCSREKLVRILSFIGQPFWLVYNIYCLAIGSSVGNVITMISIIIALIRYRKNKGLKTATQESLITEQIKNENL